MFRRGSTAAEDREAPVFIDLSQYPVADASGDKRIKVIRPAEAADLRSLKSYILSRITVLVDLSSYAGDAAIAASLVRDSVKECGGDMWTVAPSVLLATPYDVTVDNGD